MMSVTVLRFLLVLGIIGHAVNMYCDRLLGEWVPRFLIGHLF